MSYNMFNAYYAVILWLVLAHSWRLIRGPFQGPFRDDFLAYLEEFSNNINGIFRENFRGSI